MSCDPVVYEVVRGLRTAVQMRIDALQQEPGWGPVPRPHAHLEFPRFTYGEAGMGEFDLRTSLVMKDLWIGEPLAQAVAGMRPEIEAATAALSSLNSDPFTVGRAVAHLCEWLMLDELEGTGPSAEEVDRRADLLFRSLRRLPLRAWVKADLVGVAVLGPALEFEAADGLRVSLRALGAADLGGEIYLEWASAAERRVQAHPSALLSLEYEAIDSSGWQPPLERAMAILRLFGVGGVAWTRVETGTESLVDIHGGIIMLQQDGGSRRTYCISAEAAARLPRFWETIGSALPSEFYWQQPEDPEGLNGAWFNYKGEAGRFGYVNERIASAIRSLESLFLREGENQRVTVTLAARAASLLAACGFDLREVRQTIRWAYEVRSRYVHGAQLSPAALRRIEKGAGGLVPLLHRCLEYNRAALTAVLLARVDKPGLLRLLGENDALQRCGAAYREVHGD